MNWITQIISLVLLSSIAFVVSPQASAVTTSKQPEFAYEIESSTKGLTVLRDGILGSGAGILQGGKAGWNEITVTAPGYGTRKIRFWIDAGKKKLVTIKLEKSRDDKAVNWKTTFKKFDAAKLEKKASVCAWYQNKTQEKQYCDRLTYLDDLFYADDTVFKSGDVRDYQSSNELNLFRKLISEIDRPEVTPAIEDFYAKHSGLLSAFQLLSLHSLLQGDCPRVFSVYTDASQTLERINTLRIHMAVCAESLNDSKLRDQIIADGMKDKGADPALAYWAFALQLPLDLTKANNLANVCAKSRGFDVRCQEALALVAKAQGKVYKLNNPSFEEDTFKRFLNIEEKLPKGLQESLYLDVADELEKYPLSLENQVFMLWINTVFSKDLTDDYYLTKRMQVASVMGGATLEKVVETIEKDDLAQLLPPIYMRRLRFSPADPNLWYRLIRSLAKAKQCERLLPAMEQGKDYLPKYNSSLLQMRGACEVDLGRNKEALITYSKVMEVNPKVWSSPYNLANVYERLGRTKEAYNYFSKTLGLKPPSDVEESVKTKIKQLAPSGK